MGTTEGIAGGGAGIARVWEPAGTEDLHQLPPQRRWGVVAGTLRPPRGAIREGERLPGHGQFGAGREVARRDPRPQLERRGLHRPDRPELGSDHERSRRGPGGGSGSRRNRARTPQGLEAPPDRPGFDQRCPPSASEPTALDTVAVATAAHRGPAASARQLQGRRRSPDREDRGLRGQHRDGAGSRRSIGAASGDAADAAPAAARARARGRSLRRGRALDGRRRRALSPFLGPGANSSDRASRGKRRFRRAPGCTASSPRTSPQARGRVERPTILPRSRSTSRSRTAPATST